MSSLPCTRMTGALKRAEFQMRLTFMHGNLAVQTCDMQT